MAIELNRGKGIPKVKIKVEYSQPATYKSWLQWPDGTKTDLGNNNEIDLSKVDGIKSVVDLVDKTFLWDVRVISATGGANEKYYIAVNIAQDGVPICAPIVKEGKFDGSPTVWWPDMVLFF